jgi:Tfp pilus assembly protein PilE
MTLVAALMNVAVVGIYTDVVNQSLKKHLFQEAQLSGLEKQLQQINLFPFMANAFRQDRAVFYYAIKHKMVGKDLSNKTENLRYNNLTAISLWQQRLIENLDHPQSFIHPSKILEDPENSEAIDRFVLPGYSKALQVFVYNQNLANEAQIACALERYHLAHNEYPDTLDVLAPQFIEKIPRDIIGGEPLHYRRTADGKFLLYSIGWNETDDGGQEAPLIQNGGIDYTKGDWVWQYPEK